MPIDLGSVAKAAPLIAKLANALAAPAKGAATRTKEKLEVRFQKGFSRFVKENVERFSAVKTIISSSTPIAFSSLYVNLYLSRAGDNQRDDDFITKIETCRYVVFTATAGSGKSMLMRYLYLRFLEVQTERLPIFVDLRELNDHPTASLTDHIRSKIADYIEDFSDSQLKYTFETGRAILFLDGFDEVDHDRRKEREIQINELAARFRDLWIFVSSRPADTFASWQKFHVYSVDPLSLQQVERLIYNIPYDEDAKSIFKKKLSEGLFNTHQQFLTNPLLAIMMLITLEQFAEVPAKIHLFYEYAFEALFGRHDATKAGFQRKRHTALPLDDFKRLFSYFCMITYARQIKSFSSEQSLEFIQRAITASQIDVNKSLFRHDLVESTCMLILDGLDYTFSHRSFQEYFSAYFMSRVKVDEFANLMPRLVGRATQDTVVSMIAEMNREKFEESWALPFLIQLHDRTKHLDAVTDIVEFDRAIFKTKNDQIVVSFYGEELPTDKFLFTPTRDKDDSNSSYDTGGRFAIYRIYGLFDEIHRRINEPLGSSGSDTEILRRIIDGELLGDDPRFASWRGLILKEDTYNELTPIVLVPSDFVWFKNTDWGRFLQIEAELIPRLLSEIQRRVDERRRGLANLFADE